IEQNRDQFQVTSIVAGENIQLLEKQIESFSPAVVSVKNKGDAQLIQRKFPDLKVYYGKEGLLEAVSHPSVDTMLSAVDGTTALDATLESIKNNHRICLANKETLVAAGELIYDKLKDSQAEIVPIDSEQSAIFQCIGTHDRPFVKRVILTASGGPFFRKSKEEFAAITVKEALNHPTWSMGGKVTIDSATLMHQALEIIAAFYLFQLEKEQVEAIIHPQSIIHSMVEFSDASVIAQLSVPDMKIPILYSLTYPNRTPLNSPPLNFAELQKLEFFQVNTETFSSIRMAYDVLTRGKNSGAVLNAANEVAVDYFFKEIITFEEIFSTVEAIFYNENFYPLRNLEDINETIDSIKNKTVAYIKKTKERSFVAM
ncbi:MAG: 1-deoxy-D-xylulose-5-phosphate reductoisomerase, partial [bacterium]|nr:1-deoxy-D-xylulose-5-phosphate reductoisomerase [bacterium]